MTYTEVYFSHDRSKTSRGNGIMNIFVQEVAQSGSSLGVQTFYLSQVPLVTDSVGSCFYNQTHIPSLAVLSQHSHL